MKPGKFELDLVHLFNKDNPLIYKLGEGKYVIDLAETFKRKNEVVNEAAVEKPKKKKKEAKRAKQKKGKA